MRIEGRIPCGICIIHLDHQLSIVDANQEACKMFGFYPTQEKREPMSLKPILSKEDFQSLLCFMKDRLQKHSDRFEYDIKIYDQNQKNRWLHLCCIEAEGEAEALCCAVFDISAVKEQGEEFQKQRNGLRTAMTQAGIFWAWYDLKNRELYLSDTAVAEFGFEDRYQNVPDSVLERDSIIREDREKFAEFFRQMYDGAQEGSAVVQMKSRQKRAMWFRGQYTLAADELGNKQWGIITFEDITAQRKREISYKQWYQLFERQVMDSILYYEYNLTKNELLNSRGRIPIEVPSDESTFTDITVYVAEHFVVKEDRELYLKTFNRDSILEDFFKGKKERRCEYRRIISGQEKIWVNTSIQTMQDLDSDDVKCYVLIKNIDAQKRRQLELAEKSQKDSLTNIYNRGMGTEMMLHMLSKNPGKPAVFLIMDIDGFKQINDTSGHTAGDRILRLLAELLSENMRENDIACRFGGDEFVVFIGNISEDRDLFQTAISIGSRINHQAKMRCGVTLSIGGAIYPVHGRTLKELYDRADQALYEVKRSGKNGCMIYDEAAEGAERESSSKNPDMPSDSYEMLECNITKDEFRRLHHAPEKYSQIPETGKFHAMMNLIAENMINPDDQNRFRDFCDPEKVRARFAVREERISAEFHQKLYHGVSGWINISISPLKSENGDEIWLYVISDLDIRKLVEEIEEKSYELLTKYSEAERYCMIIEQTGTMVLDRNFRTGENYMADAVRQFTFADNDSTDEYGEYFKRKDIHPDDWDRMQHIVKAIDEGQNYIRDVLRFKRKEGDYLWCRLGVTVRRMPSGQIERLMATLNDVDEAMKDKNSLTYKKEYDELTGHSNYERFLREASRILFTQKENYAVWYINLRNFKLVNDLCGCSVGNKLLCYIADSLAEKLQPGECFARINSDHFVALIKYESQEYLKQWFEWLSEKISVFSRVPKEKLLLETTAGVYLSEGNENLKIEEMVERANIAQSGIELRGGSAYRIYCDEFRKRLLEEKKMAAEMKRDLDEKRFIVYLQPIASIAADGKSRISGAEALVRWKTESGELRMPSEFISLMEENGFIRELDRYMMEEVCRYIKKNENRIPEDFYFCINVSRISMIQEDFVDCYAAIKDAYEIRDGKIVLECTETTITEDSLLLNQTVKKLKERGFVFALDDFGAGYSSLNMLKDISVDVVKLDRMFLKNTLKDERSRIIISAIIEMSKALGMTVLGEGIETEEQLNEMAKMGCDLAQGYFLARPAPACCLLDFDFDEK